jgi:hypothetical protein
MDGFTVQPAKSKAVLSAPLSPEADATSVYPLPGKSMLKSGKVATPLDAATVLVPERVPIAGLVPMETVTVPTKSSKVFPLSSRAAT